MDGSRQVITEPLEFGNDEISGKLIVWSKLYLDTSVVIAFTLSDYAGEEVQNIAAVNITFKSDSVISMNLMNEVDVIGEGTKKYTFNMLVDPANIPLLTEEYILKLEFLSEEDMIVIEPDKKGSRATMKVIKCVLTASEK
jgi:hypothetical protein